MAEHADGWGVAQWECSQFLPFYDDDALDVLRRVEARVYRHIERQAP